MSKYYYNKKFLTYYYNDTFVLLHMILDIHIHMNNNNNNKKLDSNRKLYS